MTYFTTPSYSSEPGGADGDTEIIYGRQSPWLMENRMVARCHDKRMAEHIAELLRRHPFTGKETRKTNNSRG